MVLVDHVLGVEPTSQVSTWIPHQAVLQTVDVVTPLHPLSECGVETIGLYNPHLPGEAGWLVTLNTLHTIDHVLQILIASNALDLTVLQLSNGLEHH